MVPDEEIEIKTIEDYQLCYDFCESILTYD